MDVILDSNIFRGDLLMRSKDIDALLDYLQKSASVVVMPQIILDEISGLYERALTERTSTFNKAINNVKLTLVDDTFHLTQFVPNISECLHKYIAHVKKLLKISDKFILPYDNSLLPQIADRAIRRKKPSGQEGQGFRDTLIWLTMLEYTRKTHEKQVVFISNNYADFGYNDKAGLHESLKSECDHLNIEINYFKDIKDFVENHSTKISFVTEDWIAEKLDYPSIETELCDKISGRGASRIAQAFQRSTGYEAREDVKAKQANVYGESKIFIYEMLNNKLVVNVTLHCEVLIELDYYYRSYNYEDDYHGITTEAKWLDVEIYLSLTVADGDVEDYEIDEWDFNDRWD